MAPQRDTESARHYLDESKKMIEKTTDPGQRAIALGLAALTHALLEAGPGRPDGAGAPAAVDPPRGEV
ncbi:hypothetical protein HUT16_03415 [Kitasatospora sp. NA04385]|uniref:hypothetical protein n=1 Tax=Kitasatospora sp. NA04385 TaxID=2742135 RepID=UPI0015915BFD|nr:hypothetical protein [Kitasatospora sp. NA04385]QKW18239.1 hypothetical protein HUT16_03415 [Kitasatospora sp. NA04385]